MLGGGPGTLDVVTSLSGNDSVVINGNVQFASTMRWAAILRSMACSIWEAIIRPRPACGAAVRCSQAAETLR